MTHYKLYIKSEKLYTVGYFDEDDKLYYICGSSVGYRPERVIRIDIVEFKVSPCDKCIISVGNYWHGDCKGCFNYSKFKQNTFILSKNQP